LYGQTPPRERARRIIAIFRQHGATTPEKAMTSQQLGLPPRFDEFMDRRGGKSGIIVEVPPGKYYLDEARLKEMMGGLGGAAGNSATGEKEAAKVRCPYCGNMYDPSSSKCPFCGASR